MDASFDKAAASYDDSFTHSAIGKMQRDIVWNYVDSITPGKIDLQILELNCGTGEDAIHFAKKGFNILATDISDEMLEITRRKVNYEKLNDKIIIKQLDLLKIDESGFEQKFDLIFSNFGGMNCISPADMNRLPAALSNLLKPDGRLIMILMPKYCLWEIKYFLLKLNFKNAFRRYSNNGTLVNLNGSELKTFYYNPGRIKKIFQKYFSAATVKPVGFFIPPSYLNNFFSTKSRTLNFLFKCS